MRCHLALLSTSVTQITDTTIGLGESNELRFISTYCFDTTPCGSWNVSKLFWEKMSILYIYTYNSKLCLCSFCPRSCRKYWVELHTTAFCYKFESAHIGTIRVLYNKLPWTCHLCRLVSEKIKIARSPRWNRQEASNQSNLLYTLW